jgi:hypothetical protein
LTCLLVLVACGSTQTPQSVSRLRLDDGQHDLWTMPAKGLTSQRASEIAAGDAVGGEIRRTGDALVVTVRFDEIEPHANRDWGVEFQIHIPGDDRYRAVTWDEYRFSGTRQWSREVDYVVATTEDGGSQHCSGLRATPDFARETVTVRLPQHCFRNAPWVVVDGLGAVSHTADGMNVDYVGTPLSQPVQTPRLVRGA